MKSIKKAFTLAEVLMVLFVIGVIATITIGVLWRNRPDEHHLKFKKAYYVTEKTIYNITHKDEFYPHNAAKPGLANTVQATNNGAPIAKAGGSTKFCTVFTQEVGVTGDINCDKNIPLDNGGNFRTSDGIVWSFPTGNSANDALSVRGIFVDASDTKIIEIDTNGTDNRPNCRYTEDTKDTCKLPDRFQILVHGSGTIAVEGVKEKEYLEVSKRVVE